MYVAPLENLQILYVYRLDILYMFSNHSLLITNISIKTHDSESRGQEEAGSTQRTRELFTCSTALKFVNALNKPP